MPSRRRRARKSREGLKRVSSSGMPSSHVMEWGKDPKNKKRYEANPTIFPKSKDASTDPKDWVDLKDKGLEAYKEAEKRGEVYRFKKKKRAEKFAAGSWKKGKDRRDAMRSYRKSKPEK